MPLDSAHPKRTSITSRITGYNVLIIAVCLLAFAWLMHTQLRWSIQQQADALGQSLLQQTHNAASGAILAHDTLSVAVLLRELASNPYISYAAFYDTNNRILAEAGKQPKSTSRKSGYYSQHLLYQGVNAGTLHLHVDMHQLQKPLTISMQSMAVIGLTLLLFVIFLSVHLGRSLAVPLNNLSNWLINPVQQAPYIQRTDEIGLLARQLDSYFIDDTQVDDAITLEKKAILTAKPNKTSVTAVSKTVKQQLIKTELASIAQATQSRSAILAVELYNIKKLQKLPLEQSTKLVKKYHTAVEKSAYLYGGRLHVLATGRHLIVFPSSHENYPCNALYCGELLRIFGNSLQDEITNSGIDLHIRLGLDEGSIADNFSLGELLLSETAQTALSLCEHSHNLLLLSRHLTKNPSIATCSHTLPISTPEDASCLKRLVNDYPSLLQEQLDILCMES